MDPEEIQEKMDALVAAAEKDSRGMTDEEVTSYEGLEKELLASTKRAALLARHAAYHAPVGAGPGDVIPDPDAKPDKALEAAFDRYLRTGDRAAAGVLKAAQTEGTPAEGGYMVPPGFRQKLVEVKKRFGGIASVAESFSTTTGNPIEWPTLDDTANDGGVAAEGSATSDGADMVFGTVSLGAYKYASGGAGNNPLKVSVELLQDSAFDVQDLVSRALGRRIARSQAKDFAIGDGSGNPLGLFHATADVQTASGGDITYAALLDLVHAVDPDYRENGVFVMNDGTLKMVRGLLDANDRPIWQPAQTAGIQTLPGGILLGRPVVIDQAAPDFSATATDDPGGSPVAGEAYMAFGDIAEAFVIRNVRDVVVVVNPYTSGHLGLVEFSAWARADATIQNRAAYALLQGYHA